MKKCYGSLISFFVLFILTNTVLAQETPEYNDWIRQFDGIPIHAGVWWGWANHPRAFDSLKAAGVDVIQSDIGILNGNLINPGTQMEKVDDYDLQMIPVRSRSESTPIMNYIQHYTDAKYSVWEAEGNDNYDVNLERNNLKTELIPNGDSTSVRRIGTITNSVDTLIKGPYYCQDVKYLASNDNTLRLIEYRAEFRLKLEENPNYPPPIDDNPEDTICVIQVTQSSVSTTGGWHLDCTDVIKERGITLGEFNQLNKFQGFLLHANPDSVNYTLETNYCDSTTSDPSPIYTFQSSFRADGLLPGPRWIRSYIQFKVIWKGKSNVQGKPAYLLSVDKVTLSDDRGRELFVDSDSLFYRNLIVQQANSLNNYNADELVTGWMGIDEPVSIDIFEPIRIVKNILDDASQRKRPLWIAMMGHWDGRWNNHNDPFGGMGKSPWVELKKRIGNANIIQNAYMFDSPCTGSPNDASACLTGEDYRSINIWRTARLMYK